ncbi:phytanoyl-CoA dioxygenase family protein [Actinacidiphila bryophytorum]|uniref:Ectoine hydroxylase-related dioxygenase, phytanoyl-CoA dioxygenase (PhyH) family n=1 Tax=Actinacidiphila bryophytorum TaxID=1436133 RepID=A0A9W4H166_9ACTN|nr:phytanoyl-CoA dioxygenase family protein [Actinacidiphila bryophytorum]MBM9434918.1 phytanoyl-CoA dioxygenase family protein [Actinacidiphila bryophytorum]MBN6546591.1 phytanoyl-CoA dioxygenase family protein [Actinacidiphila bryophytorum]CAG7641311.1 Ectoine hydroxylase-related dioxygenase, phytanoyl-CoA dioxygenase (PhyH) family [Actinacidiphila bryophytorum]
MTDTTTVSAESPTSYSLTDADAALLPDDDDVAFYAEHGWFLTEKLLTDAEVDELAAASERYYRGERSRTLPVRPPRLAAWQPSDGPVQRHNDYVHVESDPIARILRKPLIGAVAARLAGAAEIRVFQSTLILKPAVEGEPSNIVPWHFDKHYWATSTSERMLTAFIPFHDCDEEMGTLTVVDGSHRWKETGREDSMTRHFADRDKDDLERVLAENAAYNNAEIRKVPLVIPKGHMSFHHCLTYHGSGPNRSGRPRRAVSFHLQDGGNEYRAFALSDGTQAAYNHDVLVRRLPDGRPDYADPAYCPVLWRADRP